MRNKSLQPRAPFSRTFNALRIRAATPQRLVVFYGGFAVAVSVLLYFGSSLASKREVFEPTLGTFIGVGSELSMIFAAFFAASLVARDFGNGSVSTYLPHTRSRTQLLLVKLSLALWVTLPVGLIALVAAHVVAPIMIGTQLLNVDFVDWLKLCCWPFVGVIGASLFGALVGAATRNPLASFGTVAFAILGLDLVFAWVPENWHHFNVPYSAILQTTGLDFLDAGWSLPQLFSSFVVWFVTPAALAYWSWRRVDL